MTRVQKYGSRKDPKQLTHSAGGETESWFSKPSFVATPAVNLEAATGAQGS